MKNSIFLRTELSSKSGSIQFVSVLRSIEYFQHIHSLVLKSFNVSVLESDAELHKKIDLLLNPDSVGQLKQQLSEKSEQLKKLSEEMWKLVFAEIDKVNK